MLHQLTSDSINAAFKSRKEAIHAVFSAVVSMKSAGYSRRLSRFKWRPVVFGMPLADAIVLASQ